MSGLFTGSRLDVPDEVVALIVEQIRTLHQMYPCWRVRRVVRPDGTPGGWVATRRVPLTHSQRAAGLLPELVRSEAVDLVVALAVQAEMERPAECLPDERR